MELAALRALDPEPRTVRDLKFFRRYIKPMFAEKPRLTKSNRKPLRKRKWEHAEEISNEMIKLGYEFQCFPSFSTPHFRIEGTIDYWPATTRFFDSELKCWGIGYEPLLRHIEMKRSMHVPKF